MNTSKRSIIFLRLFYGIMLFCLSLTIAHAKQDINVSISRSKISADETVKLSISVKGETNLRMADTRPLEKDFIIISNTLMPQMLVINGRVDARTDLIFILAPKKTGKLTIPALQIGPYKTNPLSIQVLSSSSHQLNKKTHQAIFLEASVDNKTPYVQGQIIYRLRLFFRENIARGTLRQPKIDNALVMPLGKDKEYQKQIDGHQYQVHERTLVIFPQKSGKITIEPSLFSGVKESRNSYQNQVNVFFNQLKPVRRVSAAITLDIKPIPASATASNWLPSKKFSLNETWEYAHTPPRAGEPITRLINIRARGITAEQLPPIDVARGVSDNISVYPERPQRKNLIDAHDVLAEQTQRIVYIPTQSGTITLPEINIHWWNTQRNRAATGRLPAKKIRIIKAATTASPTSTNTPSSNHQQTSQPLVTNASLPTPSKTNYWLYIAIAFGLAWLITLAIFLRRYHRPPSSIEPKNSKADLSTKQCLKQLKTACQQNNAQQAKSYLHRWAQAQWPNTTYEGLNIITQQAPGTALSEQLAILNHHLYSTTDNTWDGQAFWTAFETFRKTKPANSVKTDSALPPLNPL